MLDAEVAVCQNRILLCGVDILVLVRIEIVAVNAKEILAVDLETPL